MNKMFDPRNLRVYPSSDVHPGQLVYYADNVYEIRRDVEEKDKSHRGRIRAVHKNSEYPFEIGNGLTYRYIYIIP